MAVDLTVRLPDEPGQLARLGETLGNAGINIEGICAITAAGEGEVHLAVEDGEAATTALRESGVDVITDWDVSIVDCKDAVGELGRLARKVSDAGLNLTVAYLATNTRIVLGADDSDALASLLG
jgi:hypothetical protein